MKTLFLKFAISCVSIIFLQACTKDDTYTNLPQEAKDLLLYEIGDTFKLRNVNTNEIILLTVNSKEIYYTKDSNPGWWLGSSGGDNYYQRGEFTFSDVTNCHNGSVSVETRGSNNFTLKAFIGECFGNINDTFEYQNEPLTITEVNGITYTDVYLIKSYSQTIFYTKSFGIIKIVNNSTQATQFVIAE